MQLMVPLLVCALAAAVLAASDGGAPLPPRGGAPGAVAAAGDGGGAGGWVEQSHASVVAVVLRSPRAGAVQLLPPTRGTLALRVEPELVLEARAVYVQARTGALRLPVVYEDSRCARALCLYECCAI